MGAGRTCEHRDLHHALHPAGWVFSKDTHPHHVPSSPPAPTSSALFSLPFAGRTSIFSYPMQSPSSHVLPCPGPAMLPPLPCASAPTTFLLLLQGTAAETSSRIMVGTTSQLGRSRYRSWGSGEPPLHTHLLAAKPICISPCSCLGGEMSGLTAASRAQWPHPTPHCRAWGAHE